MIVNANCLEWLRAMPDDYADHCIMDPPYSNWTHTQARAGVCVQKDTRKKKNGRRMEVSRAKDFGFDALSPALMDGVAIELGRVVKRWAIAFCDVESSQSWRLALSAGGMRYVRTMIWLKRNSTPSFCAVKPASAFECMVVAHSTRAMDWNAGGKRGFYDHACENGPNTETAMHTTPKPIPLMLDLVEDFTDAGELVIDPFAGSGSTGVACILRGRRFLGCEIDPIHVATAAERLVATQLDSTIDARRGGQLALAEAAQ